MRYTCEIDIELPLSEVIEKFDNFDNLKHWQPGLQSIEPLSGTPGEPGARTRLVYQMGKRKIQMIETITKNELPHAFDGTYEASGALNEVKNSFKQLNEVSTRWTTESTFHFKGMMKLIAFLMPGAFRKQTMKYLHHFKNFAEKGISVADK